MVVELPGADHLPWEGAQEDVLDEIEAFLGGLDEHGETERDPHHGARGRGTRRQLHAADRRPLPRHGARRAAEGRVRASFDGPARAVRCASALAEVQPELRAGVHTGECERRGGRLSGAALEIAAGVVGVARPGEILATSTVHDLVAGSGVAFAERGAFALPLAGASREWRLFAVAE